MWTINFLLLLLLQFSFSASAQQYKLVKEIPVKGRYLKVDNFGNTYIVNHKNELHKFQSDGTALQFYGEIRFGKVGHIDVSNPMKPLVYFPSFNTIRILDVTLSDKGVVNLMELGFDRVNAMCLSLDNNIWIYDEITFRLKKINDKLEIINQSEDLTTLLQASVKPNFIIEKDNQLFVNDPDIGILVFDVYATYNKTIPIKDIKEFQKIKDFIYYYIGNQFFAFNMKTLDTAEIPLPEFIGELQSVKIENGLLSILTNTSLLIYSF